MRTEDIKHYFIKLRGMVENPCQVVRFRKRRGADEQLAVTFRDGRRLMLRGLSSDFYIFRIASFARQVVCDEPSQENMSQLAANLSGYDNVTLVPEAVASKPGRVRLYRPRRRSRTGQYSLYPQANALHQAHFEDVQATTLDALFAHHNIKRGYLIKLDVEGAEYDILYATNAETFAKIQAVYGEYHKVCPTDRRTRIETLVAFPRGHGFEVETVPHRKAENLALFFATRAGLS
jgi:FkbM family methyltransferase